MKLGPTVSATSAMLVRRLLLVAANIAAIPTITYKRTEASPRHRAYKRPKTPPT